MPLDSGIFRELKATGKELGEARDQMAKVLAEEARDLMAMELPSPDEGFEIGEGRLRLRVMARSMKPPLPDDGLDVSGPPSSAASFVLPADDEVHLPAALRSTSGTSPQAATNIIARLPPGPNCSCGRCAEKTESTSFRALQSAIAKTENPHLFKFTLIRQVFFPKADALTPTTKPVWELCGQQLCERAFRMAMGMTKRELRTMKKHAQSGAIEPPLVIMKPRRIRDAPQTLHARAWLRWIYERWAADFAEVQDLVNRSRVSPQVGDKPFLFEQDVSPHCPTAGALSLDKLAERPKLVPPGCPTSLFYVYKLAMTKTQETYASLTTFKREFKLWKKVLQFQRVTDHARCTECARYTELRGQSMSQEQKENVCQNHALHIDEIFLDRDVEEFFDRLGVESVRIRFRSEVAPFSERSIVFVRIDGMDQAKFRVPRRLSMAKEFEKVWRPTLHMVGVVISGVLEAYYLLDCDLKADSNMEMTLITRSLDLAVLELRTRGLKLPSHLVLMADNTGKEMRNQWCYKYAALLVARGIFLSTSVVHPRVGHSHGIVDQRFSVASPAIANAPDLQTPEDFAELINNTMSRALANSPAKLHVEVVTNLWNFKEWLAPLESGLKNITITKHGESVNHMFRFVRRKDLGNYRVHERCYPWHVVNTNKAWDDMTEDPDDTVCLIKHYMHSNHLSQEPLLVLPKTVAANVKDLAPTLVLERNLFSDQVAHEYEKTAKAISAAPWELTRAAEYLMNLVENNQHHYMHQKPPHLQLLSMDPVEFVPLFPDQFTEWFDFAPGTPKPVEMAPSKITAKAKGKAGAKQRSKRTPTEGESKRATLATLGGEPAKRCRLRGKTPPPAAYNLVSKGRRTRVDAATLTKEQRKHLRETGQGCSKCRWLGQCNTCHSKRKKLCSAKLKLLKFSKGFGAKAAAKIRARGGRFNWGHSMTPTDALVQGAAS